MVISTAHT